MSGEFFRVRSRDGGEAFADMLGWAARLKVTAQRRLATTGLRAYMRVVRLAAAAAAPFESFKKTEAYRGSVKATRSGGARGTLASAGHGNILEAGTMKAGWVAPMEPKADKTGRISPGLRAWLAQHKPGLIGGKSTGFRVEQKPAKPWVIPAHEQAQERAMGAFEAAVAAAIDKISVKDFV